MFLQKLDEWQPVLDIQEHERRHPETAPAVRAQSLFSHTLHHPAPTAVAAVVDTDLKVSRQEAERDEKKTTKKGKSVEREERKKERQ